MLAHFNSIHTVFHTFYINQRNRDVLQTLASNLASLLKPSPKMDLPLGADVFLGRTAQIAQNIINAKQDRRTYSCVISYDKMQFSISQCSSDPSNIVICHLETKEKFVLSGVQFSELKKCALRQFIAEHYFLDNFPIPLGLFDLSTFVAAQVDLGGINFSGTVLTRKNLEAVIACQGNLAGATLANNMDVSGLSLHGAIIDKTMASALIQAGVDVKSVLMSYLATQPHPGSRLYKAEMLKQYMNAERAKNKLPIDLHEFDLSDVKLNDIDFTDALLNLNNFNAIVAGNGNWSKALLSNEVALFLKKQQTNFEHDFLAMLTVYSQTVAAIVLKSTSRDVADHVPENIYKAHRSVFKDYIYQDGQNISSTVDAVIKSSTGNCGEMAGLCKSLFDVYLAHSLRQLGYHDISINSFFACAVDSFSNHAVVLVECSHGLSQKYLVDPWCYGKAWTYEEGMQYFRNHPIDRYVHPTITFFKYKNLNAVLERADYQSYVEDIFIKTGVKEQLEATIRRNKANFVSSIY